jgi:DNA-binding CsgD family transcriptional regulator
MSSESAYPNPELTPRETEVLERMANGMSSSAIALFKYDRDELGFVKV